MQPQATGEYQKLLTDVIKKQIVVLGKDITLAKVRSVSGLSVLDDGTVMEITGNPAQITQRLIDAFMELSELIVKKTMEPLLTLVQINQETLQSTTEQDIEASQQEQPLPVDQIIPDFQPAPQQPIAAQTIPTEVVPQEPIPAQPTLAQPIQQATTAVSEPIVNTPTTPEPVAPINPALVPIVAEQPIITTQPIVPQTSIEPSSPLANTPPIAPITVDTFIPTVTPQAPVEQTPSSPLPTESPAINSGTATTQ